MYAQLGSSYQWKLLNQNDAMMDKINTILNEGQMILPDNIPSAVLKMKNRNKSPITSKIFEAVTDGEIVMVYAPNVRIPLYLPFIVTQPAPNSFTCYVFLNNIVTSGNQKDTTKEIELNDRQFKVIMESAYLSLQIRKMGESPKLRSSAILKSGAKIYSGIVTECINRKHSIKLDQNLYNCILYLTSKYYIVGMLGNRNMDPEALQNYCLYNCKQFDIIEMSKITDQFELSDFDNIGAFISKITQVPEFKKRLGTLTVTNFLESYINMYDTPMLLGLEVFPYFLFNIIAVNESTYQNNYQALKNIVGDDGKKIYADLIVSVS